MAFVPGFTHDVFISYAHANNDPLTDEDKGYVTKFYENLEQFLTAELGRPEYFSVYRDEDQLRGNHDFDAKLSMAFLNSAVMVSISSQSYIESAWCRRELISFSNQTHPIFTLKVDDAYRVFRAEVGPIREPHKDIPNYFFNNELGYKFYEMEGGIELPFRRTKPDNDDQRYWRALRRLARDIAQLLRQMKKMVQAAEPQAPQAAQAAAPPENVKTVYLAETADDLEDQRNEVKSALEQYNQMKTALTQAGIRVIPEFPLSLGDPEVTNYIKRAIGSADLTVHLIGELPGKKSSLLPLPLVPLQWELAKEVAKEKALPRLAWLSPDLEINGVKEQHKLFLASLEEKAEGRVPSEVLRIGVEELRETIFRRLFPPPPPNQVATVEEQEEIDRLVYLTYLPADRDGAIQLKEALRKERLDVKMFSYDDRDSQMLARIHNASLQKSDGVMILYGTDVVWLDQLVEEARDTLKARAKKNPLKVVCIYEGPPPKDVAPVDWGYEKFISISCRDGLRPEKLKEFVELIKA